LNVQSCELFEHFGKKTFQFCTVVFYGSTDMTLHASLHAYVIGIITHTHTHTQREREREREKGVGQDFQA